MLNIDHGKKYHSCITNIRQYIPQIYHKYATNIPQIYHKALQKCYKIAQKCDVVPRKKECFTTKNCIDGVTGENAIADLWRDHYDSLLSDSTHHDGNEMFCKVLTICVCV